MNILFLSELFYPHGGGAEFATYLYAKFLRESGFRVSVVTNKFDGEKDFESDNGITIYRLRLFKESAGIKHLMLKNSNILTYGLLSRLFKQASIIYVPRLWYSAIPWSRIHRKPVLVHVHDYTPICPLALLKDSTAKIHCERRLCSPKCIYDFERVKGSTLRNSTFSTLLNLGLQQVLKTFVEEADAIVCVSKAQEKILRERMHSSRHKFHVVYNPLPELSTTAIKGNDYAYFGGNNVFKGFKILLDALRTGVNLSIQMHVAGIRGVTNNSVSSFGSSKVVTHGWIPHSQQGPFYDQIKAVVFPSIVEEPLPYLTAEALMRARVLIASRVGGVPEQVAGCKGAFLFESGNYLELSKAIEYVESLTREQLLDMANQNQETFTRNFNNEVAYSGFIRIIDEIS